MAWTVAPVLGCPDVAASAVIFPPCDEDYGMRDFGIETPDGHRLNFGSPR